MDETLDQRGRVDPSALGVPPTREQAKDSSEQPAKRRPWLVEFAGTPRAGKTTLMHGLSRWLTEDGWCVRLVEEQAELCPVPNKNDVDFNIWTACSTICRILDGHHSSADFVLVDRGVFDALCWLEWHRQRGLDPDVHDSLLRASTLVTGLIDLIVVMIVDPVQSLRRDSEIRHGRGPGAIMNVGTLEAINHSIGTVAARSGEQFRLESVDTSLFTELDTLHYVKRIVDRSRPALAPCHR